jgi:N-acetylglutamate synthase-like GNAT family acetyltransferase
MTYPNVRRAESHDAEAAVAVLRESIAQLCVDDHKNDPATLDEWLRNKTADQFRAWVSSPSRFVIVAEDELGIAGVAAFHISGEIRLCYVRPGLQGLGIGRSLVTALEAQATAMGIRKLYLKSTSGARSFYEHRGYVGTGPATCGFGSAACFPYEKVLLAEPT